MKKIKREEPNTEIKLTVYTVRKQAKKAQLNRNEGRDLSREGGDVIREACKWLRINKFYY